MPCLHAPVSCPTSKSPAAVQQMSSGAEPEKDDARYLKKIYVEECEALHFRPSCPSLPPPDPRSESRDAVAGTPPFKRLSRFTPGALVPVRVMLSRSIFTYSAPSAPLASTSRFHRHGLYGMPSLCVQRQRLGDQRVVPCFRWLFFIDMSSSETPGAPRLLTPSSFAVNACLRPGARVSASPILLILRFS